MFAISSLPKKLLQKLQGKGYRDAYVAEHVRRGIAYQIRALRDQRGWNQGKLSQRLGKPQSVVSRMEDPSYGKVTVQTLLELASTFDIALQVRFVPYSTFLQQTRDLSTPSMQVQSFADELGARPNEPIRIDIGSVSGGEGIRVFDIGPKEDNPPAVIKTETLPPPPSAKFTFDFRPTPAK